MHRLALFAVAAGLAAGCTDNGGDDYPIRPQDDFQVSGSGFAVIGRVCVASDLRNLIACSSTNAGGLTVRLGTVATTTAADGTFTFPVPADAAVVATGFAVSGTSTGGMRVVTTSSPFATTALVPAVDADVFARTLSSLGVPLDQGGGTLLVSVTRGGVPADGVTVTTTPAAAFGPFFDSASPEFSSVGATGTRGTILIPGLAAGTVDLSFNRVLGGLETTVAGVTVRNGGVTILDTALPNSIP